MDLKRASRFGIRDIARAAGVSEATVDRVLHGRPNVRRSTAERVLAVAAEHRYLPEAELAKVRRRDRLRMVVVLPGGANSYIRGLNEELRIWAQSRDRGARIQSFLTDSMGPEEMARCLRRLGRKADAVAFFGVDHPMVRDEANALVDAGKTVMTLISDVTGCRRQAYIGIDNLAAGRTAAFLMARAAPPGGGKLAIVAATRHYRAHVERELGFQELIQKDWPNLQFAGTVEGQDDPHINARLTAELLERTPDLIGIYNVGGASEGIGAELRRRGKAGQVQLIGHGLSPGTRQMLADGIMSAVLTQRSQSLLEVMVDQLHAVAAPPFLPLQFIFPTNLP
ncbi:LacI family DNA-binding transcriptional regulator [Paracoccus siganidrum]|uniref:LacI family DNA-binding transcriptional regulator n=1 Tax=Paracoccus siganidrum TaxID=1276757 RepID=A0A418ZZJ3_9RHOB|nr:LacI family DNA-binding transcriptional regulator [Paracoccus siganidrum]RJL05915.1 LacI family DNA-binding transcriptional regulator [Paracoccus siganidrum]RMC33011.1 LacI family transcriptional regulator [Paracoccus siganidrum]